MKRYYIKKGKKYVPVIPFTGFPADGLWVVKDCGKSNQLLLKISGIEDVSELIKLGNLKAKIKDIIVDMFINNELNNKLLISNASIDEVADKVSEIISKKLLKERGVDDEQKEEDHNI